MADILVVFIASVLSLLPFHLFFNVNSRIVTISFISSLLSTLLLSKYTAVERPQLYIIAINQSSLLVLGALVAQVSNDLSISALQNLFKSNLLLLLSGDLTYSTLICSTLFCLLLCSLNYLYHQIF